MATKRLESWVVSDVFWARVEPLVPARVPVARKQYLRKPGAGRPPKPARQVFEAIVYVLSPIDLIQKFILPLGQLNDALSPCNSLKKYRAVSAITPAG